MDLLLLTITCCKFYTDHQECSNRRGSLQRQGVQGNIQTDEKWMSYLKTKGKKKKSGKSEWTHSESYGKAKFHDVLGAFENRYSE